MASITVRAFAKINLSLRVKNSGRDGFHELETIFQAIDLFDRVRCETRRGSFAIRCSMPGVPADRSNLVWRAAEQLWAAAGRRGEPRDTLVTLDKKIPMQGGLGGGSSDAAAALLALRRLWKLRLADDDLYAIAAKLGSDVPYFLIGGTALGLRHGDEVYPLEELPRMWVVLVMPPFGIRTKDAYAWLDEMRAEQQGQGPRLQAGSRSAAPFLSHLILENDLEEPVIARHPVIGEIKQRLVGCGALMAAMSGSGSTVFGLFSAGAAARKAAKAVEQLDVGTQCARFLSRRGGELARKSFNRINSSFALRWSSHA
jgi:4-diphosphocytidyl-2-C-methyl-D-erythritol kinase